MAFHRHATHVHPSAQPATVLLRFKLTDPAPDGAFTKPHVFTDLADAQALGFDHLCDLKLKARVKDSSRFVMFTAVAI